MSVSLEVPAGSRASPGPAPHAVRSQRGRAQVRAVPPLTHRAPRCRWWGAGRPGIILPGSSRAGSQPAVAWSKRKRKLPLTKVCYPEREKASGSARVGATSSSSTGETTARTFQWERKTLTKVEEGIQRTRNSQWGTAASKWEPIRVRKRRGLMLPSGAPRTPVHSV